MCLNNTIQLKTGIYHGKCIIIAHKNKQIKPKKPNTNQGKTSLGTSNFCQTYHYAKNSAWGKLHNVTRAAEWSLCQYLHSNYL